MEPRRTPVMGVASDVTYQVLRGRYFTRQVYLAAAVVLLVVLLVSVMITIARAGVPRPMPWSQTYESATARAERYAR